jgi:CBS-domain-containing membrane protein
MYVTGTFHPPAGINPLLVVSGNLPSTFLLAPVLAGALLLTAFSCLWHRGVRGQPWPQQWWSIQATSPCATEPTPTCRPSA